MQAIYTRIINRLSSTKFNARDFAIKSLSPNVDASHHSSNLPTDIIRMVHLAGINYKYFRLFNSQGLLLDKCTLGGHSCQVTCESSAEIPEANTGVELLLYTV